jgi:ribosome-binding protein aMBF1 (putative translation factor)
MARQASSFRRFCPWRFCPWLESIGAVTLAARKAFAANLRRERQERDLSQETLGFRSGLDTSEVGKLERSERDPRLATIVKLGNALGIPPAHLLDGIP